MSDSGDKAETNLRKRSKRAEKSSDDRSDNSRVEGHSKERHKPGGEKSRRKDEDEDRHNRHRHHHNEATSEKNHRRRSRDRESERDSPPRRRRRDDRESDGEKRLGKDRNGGKEVVPEGPSVAPQPTADALVTRTGGAYLPPAKLRMLQAKVTDKNSAAYQRIAWEALKKSLHGLVNKVNAPNLKDIVRELFQENLIRGRGLLTRSLIIAQSASTTFTHVYAALVAVINTKFPSNGELVLKRLITDFKKAFKRNNKAKCLSSTQFVAHLVNQQVAHEILALEILALLLEQPTDDSVEVAIGFLKECGAKLSELSPRGMTGLFDRLRSILNEAMIEKRVQYMIEVMFQIRRDGFKDNPAVIPDLDLVPEDDQFTHMMTLEEDYDVEEVVNVFKFDPDYLENEEKYNAIKAEILGDDGDSDGEGSGSESGSSGEESEDEEMDEEAKAQKQQTIVDNTETNLLKLRRTIYLVIQSSLDFEEAAHKMLKLEVKPGQEYELCNMVMDCCAQLRTYEKFYGLLAGRFCSIHRKYVEEYEKIFAEQYNTIHRLETVKLRNVAKFFGHLLHTDSISWGVLQAIRLNEDDTTSSARIFIKILMQELCEFLGIVKLNERLKDPTLQIFFEGLFPRGNPRDTRFAINFFTAIGLGGLTVDLREFLKQPLIRPNADKEKNDSSDDDSSSSSSDSSSSDSDSESEKKNKRKNKKENKGTKKKSIDRERDSHDDKGNSGKYKGKPGRDFEEERSRRDKVDIDDDSYQSDRRERDNDEERYKDDKRNRRGREKDEECERRGLDNDEGHEKRGHDNYEERNRRGRIRDKVPEIHGGDRREKGSERDRRREKDSEGRDRNVRTKDNEYDKRESERSGRDIENSHDRSAWDKDDHRNRSGQEKDNLRERSGRDKNYDRNRRERNKNDDYSAKITENQMDIDNGSVEENRLNDQVVVDYETSDDSDDDRKLVRSHVTMLGTVFGDKKEKQRDTPPQNSVQTEKSPKSERHRSHHR